MIEKREKPTIGVIFHPWFPPESLKEYARKAEVAGFDELWLWDDCFLAGAFTSAAIALSVTERIKVGIGLLPVPAYNPVFAAMEITTLARAYPDRFMPGFGHGVRDWMERIGTAPRSPLKALGETVGSMRRLLRGEQVTLHGDWVNLEQVQMNLLADKVPPIYIGAVREKSLRIAGSLGDGTILTGTVSPAYIRWAKEQVREGMNETKRAENRTAIFLGAIVSEDRNAARAKARESVAIYEEWDKVYFEPLGIAEDAKKYLERNTTVEDKARNLPDEWLDAFCAAGSPQDVVDGVRKRIDAGADSIIFGLYTGESSLLDDYIRLLSPIPDLVK